MINLPESYLTVRRVRKDEISAIEEVQKDLDATFFKTYPKHKEWMEKKALPELISGDRIAFGVFLKDFDSEEVLRDVLIASIIIKKGSYSQEIELKNLLVYNKVLKRVLRDSETLADEDIEKLQQLLLHKVKRFCQRRNYKKLEIEIPGNQTNQISFFLRENFAVLTVRESRYSDRNLIYILSKYLSSSYYDDPFNEIAVSKWILKEKYNFYCHDDVPNKFTIPFLHYEINTLDYTDQNSLNLVEQNNASEYSIIGECIINLNKSDAENDEKEYTDVVNYINNGTNIPLRVLFDFKSIPDLKIKSNEYRIKYFTKSMITSLLGKDNSSNAFPEKMDDIGGILLNIDNKLLDKLRSIDGNFSYYLLDNLATVLNYITLENGVSPLIVFFSTYLRPGKKNVILGFSSLNGVGTLNNYDKNDFSLLDNEELDFFLAYSSLNISVLSCQPIMLFPDKDIVSCEKVVSPSVEKIINSEILDLGINHIFIDKETVFKLLEFSNTKTNNQYYNQINANVHDIVAFVMTGPIGTKQTFFEDELNSISKFFNNYVRMILKPTQTRFVNLVGRSKCRILHISMHGSEKLGLYFGDKSNYQDTMDLTTWRGKINQIKQINPNIVLIVITACHSELFAQAAVDEKVVEYAIGMQGEFPVAAAAEFTEVFYENLLQLNNIQIAFNLACESIKVHKDNSGRSANLMPKLFPLP